MVDKQREKHPCYMMEEPLTWNIILKTFLIRRIPRVLIVKKKTTTHS